MIGTVKLFAVSPGENSNGTRIVFPGASTETIASVEALRDRSRVRTMVRVRGPLSSRTTIQSLQLTPADFPSPVAKCKADGDVAITAPFESEASAGGCHPGPEQQYPLTTVALPSAFVTVARGV